MVNSRIFALSTHMKVKHLWILLVGVSIFGMLNAAGKYFAYVSKTPIIRYENFHDGFVGMVSRPLCNDGKFSLPDINDCHHQLGCRDIQSDRFEITRHIGHGAVKSVMDCGHYMNVFSCLLLQSKSII